MLECVVVFLTHPASIVCLLLLKVLYGVLHQPNIQKCPQCHSKLGSICSFCSECGFNITQYLLSHPKKPSFPTGRPLYHRIAMYLFIATIITLIALLQFKDVIIKYEMLTFSLWGAVVVFIALAIFFYLMGLKCPVCGQVNSMSLTKYCPHCSTPHSSL